MKVLIASDSFKNSLSSREIAFHIANIWGKFCPNDTIQTQILADGGEGSIEVIKEISHTKEVFVTVKDPINRNIVSSFLIDKGIAYIELSKASGIELISKEDEDVIHSNTYGTGQLLRNALMLGAKKIFIFVGGSATHDIGLGMAEAVGFQFFGDRGRITIVTPSMIQRITDIGETHAKQYLAEAQITVLTDVVNPLTGDTGAARVYAAQKGASAEEVEFLEQCSNHMVELTGLSGAFQGAGAAGGFGFGAKYFFNATIESGIEYLLKRTKLEEKIKDADLVITGEGRIDDQSIHGKLISGVSRLAMQNGVPCLGICALNALRQVSPSDLNLVKIYSLYDAPPKKIDISETFSRLKQTIVQMAREWTKE